MGGRGTQKTQSINELENKQTHMIRSLQAEVKALKKDNTELRQQMDDLSAENEAMRVEVTELREKQEEVEVTLDDHANRSRRNNLVIYNLDSKQENETWDDVKETVKDLIAKKLKIKEPVEIERAHRTGVIRQGKTRPVVVKFLRWGDKEKVKKSGRQLQGTNVFINEDFSPRIRAHRRHLVNYAKKNAGQKRWTVQYDTLLIDSKPYYYDEGTDMVMERRKKREPDQLRGQRHQRNTERDNSRDSSSSRSAERESRSRD